MQDNRGDRPASRLFIAQQVVSGVQIQDVQTLIALMREAPVQIVDDRAGGRQDGPLRQRKTQNMQLGCAHVGKQLRYPMVSGRLGDRIGRGRQNARQRFEAVQQRRGPGLTQSSVDDFEKRRQDGSTPKVPSRAWCRAVAAASSTSIG